MRPLTTATLAVALSATAAPAQVMQFDTTSLNYTMTFTDLDGQVHVLDVETLNRIEPLSRLRILGSSPLWTYVYEVENVDGPMTHTPLIGFYVKYELSNEWVMNTSRLAVERSVGEIPVDGKGAPAFNSFQFITNHSAVDVYTYTISLSSLSASAGTDLYIAANGSVHRPSPGTSHAWGSGTRWIPEGDTWGTYFLYTVSDCT